jgi:hypothetical protein
VSYRVEHPVYCARREDLGCKAEHPRSKWDSMKADREGWFHSKAEGLAHCPAHLPDWVPAWREKQARNRYAVKSTFTRLPSVLKCAGCEMGWPEESGDPEALKALRAAAFQHARETGHAVTVTTTQELSIEPSDS